MEVWWRLGQPGGHGEGPDTRSHPELGRESPQRRWYCLLSRGRVGRCQVAKPPSIDAPFSPAPPVPPDRFIAAGWSSPVARQAHNLKVGGSNPPPATNFIYPISRPLSLSGLLAFVASDRIPARWPCRSIDRLVLPSSSVPRHQHSLAPAEHLGLEPSEIRPSVEAERGAAQVQRVGIWQPSSRLARGSPPRAPPSWGNAARERSRCRSASASRPGWRSTRPCTAPCRNNGRQAIRDRWQAARPTRPIACSY